VEVITTHSWTGGRLTGSPSCTASSYDGGGRWAAQSHNHSYSYM